VVVVTALLGVRLYRRASEAAFRRVVLALLALSGAALLTGAVRDIMTGG